MDAQKRKAARARRRQFRVRKAIRGTAAKPRLSVFRSNLHVYAQLIDDENQVTLAAVGSREKGKAGTYGGNAKAAVSCTKIKPQKPLKFKCLGPKAGAIVHIADANHLHKVKPRRAGRRRR